MNHQTPPKDIFCALYVRSAIKLRSVKDESLKAQEELLRMWASEEKLLIYDVYIDNGYSGMNLDRPGIARLREDAKNKKFQVLLCYGNDKLSRNIENLVMLVKELKINGVKTRTSTDSEGWII